MVSIYIKVHILKQNSSDVLVAHTHIHTLNIFHMLFCKITYVVPLIQGQASELNDLRGN